MSLHQACVNRKDYYGDRLLRYAPENPSRAALWKDTSK